MEKIEFASTDVRIRRNFDFDWKFTKGDILDAQEIAFDDSDWQSVDLPHDFSIEGPVDEKNPTGKSGGFYPTGKGWYRKSFSLPQEAADKIALIEFDGVYSNSDVWINGHHLGRRPNGYIGFQYDLTPYIQRGDVNVLAVKVDNSEQPDTRWYSGSGIYRHTWLTLVDTVHVAHWGTYVTTPEISEDSAVVRVRTTLKNEDEKDRSITLATTIFDSEKILSPSDECTEKIPGHGTLDIERELTLQLPNLWSPDQPFLYTLLTTIKNADSELDTYRTSFGIRYYTFDPNKGFSLNGKPMKLKGVNNHHDAGCVGAAVPDRMLERRWEVLKEMGCNAIRTAHNPHAPELLDMCDRMGFLVIDEIFDEWRTGKREFSYHRHFDTWWKRDLTDQILRDRNHPCVILWSIGNEIREKGTEEGAATAKMLVETIHGLDTSRPVTCGCNNIKDVNASGFADSLDVVGYNGGGGSVFQYQQDHESYPERKMYASEVPHTFSTRGMYRTFTRYRDSKKPTFKKAKLKSVSDLTKDEVFTEVHERYHSSYDNALVRICARDSWRLIEEYTFMAGEFRWTGFDYLGESHGWPARVSNAGVIDLCGFPKDTYYFYQSRWSDVPMVHLLPHWTWPEIKEGTIIPVWTYSNCDTVELFLNGKSMGEQEMRENFHLSWEVPYHPGAIKAVARKNGEIMCGKERRTASAPEKIELIADRTIINADGQDVVHLTIMVLDSSGNFVPYANNRIFFKVKGEGRLIGVENGDPVDHDSSKGDNRRVFAGMCLAVIQATRRPGRIVVNAASTGLIPALIQLQTGMSKKISILSS